MIAVATKKKPVIHIRSPYLPFPSGNCKMCGQNHTTVTIQLEHGGYIIAPINAVRREARDNDNNSLASLFWEES